MPVSIDIGPDGRIWAKIPYAGGRGPRDAKKVAGVRPKYEKNKSNPNGKDKFVAWTYPLEMSTCRALRDVFGEKMQVGQDLFDWAHAAVAWEEEMIKLAKSDGSDVELDPVFRSMVPALSDAIEDRPYQKVGMRFAIDGQTTINADHPGLGKTLQTLAALVESGAKRVLVFAPRTAMETVWAREARRWTDFEVAVADGTPTQRREAIKSVTQPLGEYEKPRMVVCNPEMVRAKKVVNCVVCGGVEPDDCPEKGTSRHTQYLDFKYPELFDYTWDAIVVDECHKSLIGKNVMSKNVSQTRLGMASLPFDPEKSLKIALSGTPYRGKPQLLWGILNWLAPEVFTSFWRWAEQYFEMHEGYAGSKIIGEFREDRKEAYERMLAPYMLRRTKGEVAKDLPPKMYGGTPLDPDDPESPIAVWLEMEPAQAKVYRQMAEESEADIEGGMIEAIGVLPELTRLQQFAICSWGIENFDQPYPIASVSNKYNWLLEFIQERIEEGRKVVVASQYTKVVNAFAAQLHKDGIESYTLTGETKQEFRAGMVEDFQTNPNSPPVFFINTYAGGVAITLDAADDLVLIDETYIPDNEEQVEDRIHRVSRIHQVTIWKLKSLGTIEEFKAQIAYEREAITKELLDGPRGIEFAKLLLKKAKK